MTSLELNENLAITLMSRFLNHLELLDTINSENIETSDEIVIKYDKRTQEEHGDAVLRNLLKVGRFLVEHEEIQWIGSEKRNKSRAKNKEMEDANGSSAPPLAFVVMMDKICKIGRKSNRVLAISTCLKFYAAILISCPNFTSNQESLYEGAFLSMLKLIDHVQTFTISRDQVKSPEWRSCLELAAALLDRLKTVVLGEDRHAALNLKLVKSMNAAKIKRREEKRQLVLAEPEKAAKLKQKENLKKYRSRKNKSKVNNSKRK